MSRRWRSLLARRGRFWPVAPAPAVVAPPRPPGLIEQAGQRPRWVRGRRGVFVAVPPVPVQQPAAPVPSFRGLRARLVTTVRRGQFQPLLSHRPAVPRAALTRRLRSLVPARRGVFFAVPAAPTTAAGPGPLVMAAVRGSSRRTLPPARRGRFVPFPPLPPAGPGPLVLPLRRRERARYLPQARGRRWDRVPDQVIYVPPARGSMRAAVRAAADQRAVVRGGPTSRRT